MSNQNRNQQPRYFCDEEIQVRSTEGGAQVVSGYAAVFSASSRVLRTEKGKSFTEEIAPGAFDGTDFSDAYCCFDHRDFLTTEPNLKYSVDARGLRYEYTHDPHDPIHVTALRRIQRGDAKGSSFTFYDPGPDNYTLEERNGMPHRIIRSIPRVLEFGPVLRPAYPTTTAFARSLDSAYETNTSPTPSQKKAGNYKKGRVMIAGMPIAVENPIGSKRSGTAPDGTEWSVEMKAHYGYIVGSEAADDDNLDVFFTEDAEGAKVVFVIDQVNLDGSFDEHKCIIGPDYAWEARDLYLDHYAKGWRGLGAMTEVPMQCFAAWAMDGKAKPEPLRYSRQRLMELRKLKALLP